MPSGFEPSISWTIGRATLHCATIQFEQMKKISLFNLLIGHCKNYIIFSSKFDEFHELPCSKKEHLRSRSIQISNYMHKKHQSNGV